MTRQSRIPIRSLVAMLGFALLLAACGGSVAPGAGEQSTEATASRTPAPNVVAAPSCPDEVANLLDVLQDLDSRLGVGLNFSQYSERVGDAKVAYDRIDAGELSASCVEEVGVPAENALNAYVDAYNIWNDCIGDTDCDNDSITPDLQAKWADATEALESALEALDR